MGPDASAEVAVALESVPNRVIFRPDAEVKAALALLAAVVVLADLWWSNRTTEQPEPTRRDRGRGALCRALRELPRSERDGYRPARAFSMIEGLRSVPKILMAERRWAWSRNSSRQMAIE